MLLVSRPVFPDFSKELTAIIFRVKQSKTEFSCHCVCVCVIADAWKNDGAFIFWVKELK